jgi:hypothetical protein
MRFWIWVAAGRALGLPVADLFEAISIQMQAAKRAHAGRPAPLTDQERLRLGQLAAGWSRAMRETVEWMVKPASLVRWLKRYQQRKAQKREEWSQQPQRGRPPITEATVDAIVQIYQSGITGLKRIRGERTKCGITVARSTIRRVLDDHGLPPGSNRTGQSWLTFWRNHAPETIGIDFIQVATGLLGKVTYQFALIAIEHDTRRVHLLGITPMVFP